MSPTASAAARAGPGEHAWERGTRWEHAAFVVALLTTLGVTLAQDISPAAKAGAAALLAALAGWYAAVGRSAIHRHRGRRSAVYLAGALVLFAALLLLTPMGWIVLLGLCPQSFSALPIRRAIVAVLALGLVVLATVVYWSGWDPLVLFWTALAIAIGAGLSAVQQAWIGRIVAQSRERAELIDQLDATRAELAEAQRKAGAVAERERLASEIHDTLAQGFSSILMLLQAIESNLDRDPAETRRQVEVARRTARENLDEARTLVAALAPAPLDATSLDDALRRLVDRFGTELRLPAAFRVEGDPRSVPAGAEVVLLRATQEALANARKHAAATSLDVRLSYDGEAATLVVADDGRGFHPADANGGFGLRAMRGRVEQVGGTVDADSAPGTGTTITVRVPV